MFASIRYINTHHAASSIPEQQFPIHFPGQTPLNAASLPPQQAQTIDLNTTTENTHPSPYLNSTSISHTHQNGTASVPGSIPGTPAALRDGTDTRPHTPNPNPNPNSTPGPPEQGDIDLSDDAADAPPRPDTPTTFLSALHELSRDLVTKEQQIEFLIRNLPGRERTVVEQEARIKELDAELRGLEGEVARAEEERRAMLDRVEGVILGVGRW